MSNPAYDRLSSHFINHPLVNLPIVVGFGSLGERYAATRLGRGRTLQLRVWNRAKGRWLKWRKLQPAEIKRICSAADEAKFKPDYGIPWETGP